MNSVSPVQFVAVCPVEELQSGERIIFEVADLPIVVINLAGTFFAIADRCSHDDGPVGEGDIEGNEIICPRHGARFDIKTGRATRLPAIEDIPVYPIRIVDGMVQIGIPT